MNKKYRNLLCVSALAFACVDLCYARFDEAMQANAEKHMCGQDKLFLCNKQALQESYLLNTDFRIDGNKLRGDKSIYPETKGETEIDNKKYQQRWEAGEVGTFAADIGALTKTHPNFQNANILVQRNTDGSPKLKAGVTDPLLETRRIIEQNILNNVFTNTDPDAQKLFELYTFSCFDGSKENQKRSIEEFKLAKEDYGKFKKQRLEKVWEIIRDSKKKYSVLNGYYTLYCLHKIAKLTKDVRSVVSYMVSAEFGEFLKQSKLANLKITINKQTYDNLYDYMADQVAPLNKFIDINNAENTEAVVFFMAEKVLKVFEYLKTNTEFSANYSQFSDIINKIERYKDMFEENSSQIKLTWVKNQWNDFFGSFSAFLKKDANKEIGHGFDEARNQGLKHGTVGANDKVSIQGLSKEIVEVTHDAMCYINGYKLNDFIWNYWQNIDIGGNETLMHFKTACRNLESKFTGTKDDLFCRTMPEKGLYKKNIDFLMNTNNISNREISSLLIENSVPEETAQRIKSFEDVADNFLRVDEMLEKATQRMKPFENMVEETIRRMKPFENAVDSFDNIKRMLADEEVDNKNLIKTLVEKINLAIKTHFEGINEIKIVEDNKNYYISFEGNDVDNKQFIRNLYPIESKITDFLSVFFSKTPLKDTGRQFKVCLYDYSDKLKTFLLQKQKDQKHLEDRLQEAGYSWKSAVAFARPKQEYTGIIYALCVIADALKMHNAKAHADATNNFELCLQHDKANNDALDILRETSSIVLEDFLYTDDNIASLQNCSYSAFCIPSSCVPSNNDEIETRLFKELSRLLRHYLHYASTLDNAENIEGKLNEYAIKFSKVGRDYEIQEARPWKQHFLKLNDSIVQENALIKVSKTKSASTENRTIAQYGNEIEISRHKDINDAFIDIDNCFQKLKLLRDAIREINWDQGLDRKCVDKYSKAVANAWSSVELLRTRYNDSMIRKLGESSRISDDYLNYALMQENLTHTDITQSYNMLLCSTPTCNYLPILKNMNEQEYCDSQRTSSLLTNAEKDAVTQLGDGSLSKALADYLKWSINPFEDIQLQSGCSLKLAEDVARKTKNYIALHIIKLIQSGYLKIVDSEKQKVALHDSASKMLEQRLDELIYGFDNTRKIALKYVRKSTYDIFGADKLKIELKPADYEGAKNIQEFVDQRIYVLERWLNHLESEIIENNNKQNDNDNKQKMNNRDLRKTIMNTIETNSSGTVWMAFGSLVVKNLESCNLNRDGFEKITFTEEAKKELMPSIDTAIINNDEKEFLSKIRDKVYSSLKDSTDVASFDSMLNRFIKENYAGVQKEKISSFYNYTLERITDECIEDILGRDSSKSLAKAGNLEKLIFDCFRNSSFADYAPANSAKKINEFSNFLTNASFEIDGKKIDIKGTLASIRNGIEKIYKEIVNPDDPNNLRDKFEKSIKEVWEKIREEVIKTHNEYAGNNDKILDDKVAPKKK